MDARRLKEIAVGIGKISMPISLLSDAGIAQAIMVMCEGDGACIIEGMPVDHIAMLRADQSGRLMVAFGSEFAMLTFARQFGITKYGG